MSRATWLTPSQERALVLAAERGDAGARGRLVETFMPAVTGVAGGFPADAGVERKELVQQGVVGLLVAADHYDARRETRFWSYASFWVRKAMQELVADLTGPVALSDRAVRNVARMRSARRAYLQAHGVEPTDGQLSEATGFSREQLERLHATELRPRSFHEPLRVDDDDAAATVGDAIADPAAEQAFEQVLDHLDVDRLRAAAARLSAQERTVVGAHFGLGRPEQTLDEIGASLGLSAERARQIEAGALTTMRDALV